MARENGGKERRKFARVHPDPKHPIEVQIMGNDFLDIVFARNISEGGMKIMVPHLFAGCDIDSTVEFIVTLPGAKSFLAKGKIKHLKPQNESDGSFGVKFTEIKPVNRVQIKNYVTTRLAAGAEA